jgi:WD40 repeat protein
LVTFGHIWSLGTFGWKDESNSIFPLRRSSSSLQAFFHRDVATMDRFIARRSGLYFADIPSTGSIESSSMGNVVAEGKRGVYASNLSATVLGVDSRILSYQDKTPAPVSTGDIVANLNVLYSTTQVRKSDNGHLAARPLPTRPTRLVDANDLRDDYYLNLVSWNDKNWLAIDLNQTVYLWNVGTGDVKMLISFIDEHVTSVAWVETGGVCLAIGLSSGKTQLWDVVREKKLHNMDGHSDRVGALAWSSSDNIVSSGSRDTSIIHHDVRSRQHCQARDSSTRSLFARLEFKPKRSGQWREGQSRLSLGRCCGQEWSAKEPPQS